MSNIEIVYRCSIIDGGNKFYKLSMDTNIELQLPEYLKLLAVLPYIDAIAMFYKSFNVQFADSSIWIILIVKECAESLFDT